MIPPDVPKNEAARMAMLDELDILDTLPEQAYDDIVRLAAYICGTPIALVSLVDTERQWFKARTGLGATETSREVSFCGHAVASGRMLVVPDAFEDQRFHDNPLVRGGPGVRFYAGSPLTTAEGLTMGTLCVIDTQPKDLTDEQRGLLQALSRQVVLLLDERLQQQALARALDDTERASAAKNAFMANISHELRTPLNSVIGFSSILVKNKSGNLADRELTYVKRIASNGRHLLGLINEVLDLSKVEAGQMEIRFEPTQVTELVEGVVHQLRDTHATDGAKLSVAFPDGPTAPARVNPRRMYQVLLNLVANALKAGPEVAVEVRVRAHQGQVVGVDVRDNGPGIAPEVQEAMFQPYSQGAGLKPGGTGLGLAISRRLCELQGLSLTLKSELGQGCTFTVNFDPEHAPERHVAPAASVASAATLEH